MSAVKKLFAKVPLREAQEAREKILALDALDERTAVDKDEKHLYFPVKQSLEGFTIVEREAREWKKPMTLKEALSQTLTEEESEELIGSYDVVGTIAIVEIPEKLIHRQEAIAEAIISAHANITTVLKKTGIHGGEFRTQSYECIAGIDTRETLVKESGCEILVDVEQVYFSVRLSTERLRIAALVKPEEKVLVLFSGAAPYVVVFAKRSLASRVVGVEKNPAGHEYALLNLKRNKIPASRARAYCGDAAELSVIREEGLFDRIVMMLPSNAKEFIESALAVANPEYCTLHVYAFSSEQELPFVEREITDKIRALGWHARVERSVKAGNHKPRVYRYCFDVAVRK